MTRIRSIRSFLSVFVLSTALLGVSATMPTVLANCGNQNAGGGCAKPTEPNPDPAGELPWWEALADLIHGLLTSVGE